MLMERGDAIKSRGMQVFVPRQEYVDGKWVTPGDEEGGLKVEEVKEDGGSGEVKTVDAAAEDKMES